MPTIQFLNPSRDSANVSAYSKTVLLDIMRIAGIPQIVITSTTRTAHEQARIMYENLEQHGIEHQKKLYGPYGDKIIDEYAILKRKGKIKTEIISGMTKRINALGPRNVSKHAGDPSKLNVIDIAPGSITISARSKFEATINNDDRISTFLTPPKDPAYHLEIPQPD